MKRALSSLLTVAAFAWCLSALPAASTVRQSAAPAAGGERRVRSSPRAVHPDLQPLPRRGANHRAAADEDRMGRGHQQDDRARGDRQRRGLRDGLRLPAPSLWQGLHQLGDERSKSPPPCASPARTRTPSSPSARPTATSRTSTRSRRSRTSTSRRSKSTRTRSRSESRRGVAAVGGLRSPGLSAIKKSQTANPAVLRLRPERISCARYRHHAETCTRHDCTDAYDRGRPSGRRRHDGTGDGAGPNAHRPAGPASRRAESGASGRRPRGAGTARRRPPAGGRQGGGGRRGGFTQFTRELAPQDVIVRGKALYEANCASCHAADLRGGATRARTAAVGHRAADQQGELIGACVAKHTPALTLVAGRHRRDRGIHPQHSRHDERPGQPARTEPDRASS